MQFFTCVAAPLPRGVRAGYIPDVPEANPDLERCLSPVLGDRCDAVFVAPEIMPTPLKGIVTPALAERNYGRWRGQSLRTLAANDLSALLTDADFAPPEGESLCNVNARVMTWARGFDKNGRFLIVASPAIIRALVVGALGGDVGMNTRIDVAPLSITRLTRSETGHWRLQSLSLPL